MVDVASVPPLAETARWEPTIPELQNGWPPTGGPVDPATNGGLLNWPIRNLANRTLELKRRVDDLVSTAAQTVNVGPGAQFTTINAALAYLSEKRIVFSQTQFSLMRINLRSGFTMAEQVHVNSVNLGYIEIVSEAAEVFIDRAYLTRNFGGGYPAFGAAYGGFTPIISTMFVMQATGPAAGRHGIYVVSGGAHGFLPGPGSGLAASMEFSWLLVQPLTPTGPTSRTRWGPVSIALAGRASPARTPTLAARVGRG